jgi:DNA primase
LSNFIPKEIIAEIRARISVLEVISRYVPLRRSGKNSIGCCPFHQEKTPSFVVNEDKRLYRCFGCGEGGDVFKFLSKIKGQNFHEVVRDLAEQLGISLPENSGESQEEQALKNSLYLVNDQAREYFVGMLNHREIGQEAREYLAKRGITPEVIEKFEIGLAPPSWNGLGNYFGSRGMDTEIALSAGLILKSNDGRKYYDRFRARIMFPIRHLHGKIVGFGGRIFQQNQGDPKEGGGDVAKYMNSPETPIYKKGQLLYGLNVAQSEIRQAGYAIMVEGYMDLITLHSFGFRQACAVLGTAATKEHMQLLKRYGQTLILAFDADKAGQKATERTARLALDHAFHCKVLELPEGEDPDSCLQKFGRAGFETRRAAARDFVEYFMDSQIKAQPADIQGRSQVVRLVAPVIEQVQDPVAQGLYIQKLAEKIAVDENLIRESFLLQKEKAPRIAPPPPKPNPPRPQKPANEEPWAGTSEAMLIYLMLHFPRITALVTEKDLVPRIQSEQLRLIAGKIQALAAGPRPNDLHELLDAIEREDIRDQIIKISLMETGITEDNLEKYFQDVSLKLEIHHLKRAIDTCLVELQAAAKNGDQAKLAHLNQEYGILKEQHKELHRKLTRKDLP